MTGTIERLAAPSKGRTTTLWVLRALVGLAFLAAGGAKLAGAPPMVAIFAVIGVGQWFRILTGVLEVAGALGLFIPRATFYAALLLAGVMAWAVGFHLVMLGGNPVPALVLLLLSGAIAWLSRGSRSA